MSSHLSTGTSNASTDLSSAIKLIETSYNGIIEERKTARKRKLDEFSQTKTSLKETEEKIISFQNQMTQLNQQYQSNDSRAQLRNAFDNQVKLLNSVLSKPNLEEIQEAELNQLIEFGTSIKNTTEKTQELFNECNKAKKLKENHHKEVEEKKQALSKMEEDISDSRSAAKLLKANHASLKEHLEAINTILQSSMTPIAKSPNTTTSSSITVTNAIPSNESAFTTPIRNIVTTQLTNPIINTANINKPNTPQSNVTLLSNPNNAAHITTTTSSSSSSNEKSANQIDYNKMNELRVAKKMAPMPFLDIFNLKPSTETLGALLKEDNAKLHRAILEENWSDFESIYHQNKELIDQKVSDYLPLELFFLFEPKDPEKAFKALICFLKKNPLVIHLMQDLNALQFIALCPWLNRKEVSEVIQAVCSRTSGALSFKNPDDALPMHIAASYGHAHTLQAMSKYVVTVNYKRNKQQQIDINQLDSYGFGMIHYMALDDSYKDIFKQFLSSNNTGNFKMTTHSSGSTGKKTALVIANESRSPEMAKLIG